ncbi:MAG TPA: hypothetical protein VHC97_25500 [Thermoanaerobaculia bacterium]|jgi:hypothetical protein|nr:hypothetical protein [Thermoanaerobaculia bacterium]
MTQRKLSRVIAAGLLTATLALPAQAHAAATRTRGPVNVWEWIARLWQRGISAVVPESGVGRKEGPGFDPNGSKAPSPEEGSGTGGDALTGPATSSDPGRG